MIPLLSPHYRNFSERVIEPPTRYFADTGLLCYERYRRRGHAARPWYAAL